MAEEHGSQSASVEHLVTTLQQVKELLQSVEDRINELVGQEESLFSPFVSEADSKPPEGAKFTSKAKSKKKDTPAGARDQRRGEQISERVQDSPELLVHNNNISSDNNAKEKASTKEKREKLPGVSVPVVRTKPNNRTRHTKSVPAKLKRNEVTSKQRATVEDLDIHMYTEDTQSKRLIYSMRLVALVVSLLQLILVPFRLAFLHEDLAAGYNYTRLSWSSLHLLFWLDLSSIVFYAAELIVTQLFMKAASADWRQKLLASNLPVEYFFKAFDLDGDGKLSPVEIEKALISLGERPNRREVQDTFNRIDKNQDEQIELHELEAFLNEYKAAIADKKTIAKTLTSMIKHVGIYSFVGQLVSLLPFPLVFWWCFFTDTRAETLSLLSYLSLIHMFRAFSVNNTMTDIKPASSSPSMFRLMKLVLLSFLIAHWVGCTWFLLGTVEGFGVNSFVPDLDLKTAPILTKYLRSLFWGMMASISLSIDMPHTNAEAFFSFVVVLSGVSLYASILGNVGTLLANLDSQAVEYQERLERIFSFMRYKGIPRQLQERVLDNYEYLWTQRKGLDSLEVFTDLPISIQTDIALYLNRELLQKVPFLADASESFLSALVSRLKPLSVAPGEYIIKYGDIGREMYFINRGAVIVCSQDGKHIYNVMSDGEFFGEVALLFTSRRTASVKSSTYCDLLVLTQDDFKEVMHDFPEFQGVLRKEAMKRMVGKISMFKRLSQECQEAILDRLRPYSVEKGTRIICTGDVGQEMYFLLKGVCEARSADGRRVYAALREGDFFGEVALITSQRRTADVVALTDCDLFVLTKQDFLDVSQEFEELARAIRQEISAKYAVERKQQLEKDVGLVLEDEGTSMAAPVANNNGHRE